MSECESFKIQLTQKLPRHFSAVERLAGTGISLNELNLSVISFSVKKSHSDVANQNKRDKLKYASSTGI